MYIYLTAVNKNKKERKKGKKGRNLQFIEWHQKHMCKSRETIPLKINKVLAFLSDSVIWTSEYKRIVVRKP
jgi:hypothetical protein